ncbi:MAG: peptidase [Gammaproteobacteria bacterium]|nr:MAG: peptidase [Gammaproteobacteria bacterium]
MNGPACPRPRRKTGIGVACLALGLGFSLGAAMLHYWPAILSVLPGADSLSLSGDMVGGTDDLDRRARVVDTVDDGVDPDATVLLADTPAPLVVSLHSWSADWRQHDPLLTALADRGWNYIHPDFRGASNRPEACLSDQVISDLDAAIAWMLAHGRVDRNRIFLIGTSGGGYTALGYRAKSRFPIRHTFAWVPITDLESWYYQSRAREAHYADDILGCIGGQDDRDEQVDHAAMRARSPLFWPDNGNGAVTLYAGIDDGYTGSVPISHSIDYFNRLAEPEQRLTTDETTALLTRTLREPEGSLAGRKVYLDRSSGDIRLVVFDGGHEMLGDAALEALLDNGR